MLTFYLLLLSLFVNYIENKELILANVVSVYHYTS